MLKVTTRNEITKIGLDDKVELQLPTRRCYQRKLELPSAINEMPLKLLTRAIWSVTTIHTEVHDSFTGGRSSRSRPASEQVGKLATIYADSVTLLNFDRRSWQRISLRTCQDDQIQLDSMMDPDENWTDCGDIATMTISAMTDKCVYLVNITVTAAYDERWGKRSRITESMKHIISR